jgi:hypothetical protein
MQRKTFAVTDPKRRMKPSRNWSRTVLRRPVQKRDCTRKSTSETKKAHVNTLLARCYPALYSFASRLTDDPRQALLLADQVSDSHIFA